MARSRTCGTCNDCCRRLAGAFHSRSFPAPCAARQNEDRAIIRRSLPIVYQFKREGTQNRYPLTCRIRCSECGSFYHRKVRSGVIKWVCAKHAADTNACNSSYYSEERIYDGIITMINKLRFCEEDILGQTIQKLEFAAAAYKRNNRAASQLSRSIA